MNQEYRRIVQTAAMYARSHKPPPMHRLPCTAIVDTGIFPHMDLAGSITGFYDPVGHRSSAYDDNGHGTHIAGIISGNGQSLDGRYTGIFPSSPIFCVKALNENGNGKITDFIEGIEFLIKNRTKYHIRIINISLGAEYDNSPEQKSLLDCVEHAWDLGLIVCAAASEQLEIWADRAGVPLVKAGEGADPAAVIFDTVKSATARGYDLVIADTAGRLHNKANLMAELSKISRSVKKASPEASLETLLVLDAITGQNAISQAREFCKAANATGIILTKLDGTAKGGCVVAVKQRLGLPVRFIGGKL